MKLRRVMDVHRTYVNWLSVASDRLPLARRRVLRLAHLRKPALTLIYEAGIGDSGRITTLFHDESYAGCVRSREESPSVVVDVGANRGYFALYCASRTLVEALYCYEPERRNCQILQANLVINGLEASVTAAGLVSTGPGRAFLSVATSSGAHTLAPWVPPIGRRSIIGRQEVAVLNAEAELAGIVAKHGRIDILKVDTEGTELDILGCLSDQTLRSVGRIGAEFHEPQAAEARIVALRLTSLGFDCALRSCHLEAKQRTSTI